MSVVLSKSQGEIYAETGVHDMYLFDDYSGRL